MYKLQSRPGVEHLIYLDFDGGEPPVAGQFYSLGIYVSPEDIHTIWEHIAEDYIAFNVNVTTDRALFDAHPQNKRGMVIFADFQNVTWLGLAQSSSFGKEVPAMVDMVSSSPHFYFHHVGSHELGHTFSLGHDATNSAGHADFLPLMSVGVRPVSHWSKGEYAGANNFEDDIEIISTFIDFVADDFTGARELISDQNGVIDPARNNAIIESRTDTEVFEFTLTETGSIAISGAIPDGGNLNMELVLKDENGNVITSDAPTGDLTASISASNLSAGTYSIVVDGVGEGDPSTGWSDYSSWGYFELSGTITGNEQITKDMAITAVSGLSGTCAFSLNPSIELKNFGSATVNEVEIEVYVDQDYVRTETIAVNLSSGTSETFELEAIEEDGTHEIEYVLVMSGDQVSFNDAQTMSYEFSKGQLVTFSTDYTAFNGSNPFNWEIMPQGGGNAVVSSDEFPVASDGDEVSQNYCLASGCYEFELEGDFDACFKYPTHVPGRTYTENDYATRNGILYRAKWWNQSTPPASEWETIGDCPEEEHAFSLENEVLGNSYFNASTNGYTGSYSHVLCVDQVTSLEEDFNTVSSFISMYPNPADGRVSFQFNEPARTVEVHALSGELMFTASDKDSLLLDVSLWSAGSYVVRATFGNTVESQILIVE